jgi:hypothetical protein
LSSSLLVVRSTGADAVKELAASAQVENELVNVSTDSDLGTYVEVVARLEEIMELNNVAVPSRDLLENVDFIADLDDQRCGLSLAHANTNHVLAALPISAPSLKSNSNSR